MSETIRLKFEGGIAQNGELHFYEYSRSQYGTARFIATIEHFRRHGVVAERINANSYVDIRVRSAERGSFIEDIIVLAIKEGMAVAVSTPLSALISYVWHLLSPRKESTDETIVQLAQIKLAEEAQRTEQERERTEQLRALQQIAEGHRATAADALALAKWAITSRNAAIGRLGLDQSVLSDIAHELEGSKPRARV
ncbi:MAG: hypothetical protein KF765_06560 [Parvibaculaceae bacterium]|nr:hypothetical protein [Parvibaculaceae bacterium]